MENIMKSKIVGFLTIALLSLSTSVLYAQENNRYNLRNVVTYQYSIKNLPVMISANTSDKIIASKYSLTAKNIKSNKDGNVIEVSSLMEVLGEVSSTKDLLFYNKDGALIKNVDVDNNNECQLIGEPQPLPTDAKVGDSGIQGKYKCSDGEISKKSWTLKAYKNGALFIIKTVSNSSDISVDGEERYIITPNGEIKKFKLKGVISTKELVMKIESSYQNVEGLK
jgi:hypothetical protein